jgi:hypothetical protein
MLSFRPSILDQNVLALDVAEVAQAFAERPDEICLKGSARPLDAFSSRRRRTAWSSAHGAGRVWC